VVLKENPPPLVENQQFKKTRENNYPCFFAGNLSRNFFYCRTTFSRTDMPVKKALLHTNGAKRIRVLTGEKLAARGRGISTYLSTFVLKT
jgi:hypothetical protein